MGGRGEPPAGSRQSNLKMAFQLGIRSVLTTFSKEDVWKAFPTCTDLERERLYGMFVKVIKTLHEDLKEEFVSICQETRVGRALDMVEQLVEEHTLEEAFGTRANIGEIKEKILKVKKDEIQHLTNLLEKVEDQNNLMKAHIKSPKNSHNFLVGRTVDMTDQLMEKHNLDILAPDEAYIGDIKDKYSSAKKDEVQCLKNILQKIEDQNTVMKASFISIANSEDFTIIADTQNVKPNR
ncbi:uncharacterized protein LOC141817251 [Curcuma longa]|uniref:uncharacterized protein LOC141817251 n=1 Tax=Curcuma longa TaxID=136217 RepID=UPI003D9F8C18